MKQARVGIFANTIAEIHMKTARIPDFAGFKRLTFHGKRTAKSRYDVRVTVMPIYGKKVLDLILILISFRILETLN